MQKQATTNPVYLKCEIKENKKIGTLYHRLMISLPESIGPITPGQFAMLSLGERESFLLPRPFSIYNFDNKNSVSWLEFLFKIVGKGTADLAKLSAGSSITVLAPLGNGFPAPPLEYKVVVIAGGMGIAPLFPLIVRLKSFPFPSPVSVLYGAKSEDDLVCLAELHNLVGNITIKIATEDGTGGGEKGFVTQLLKQIAVKKGANTAIYACGPEPMLKIVSDFCIARNISCWISVERLMACGVGACMGCVVKTTDGYKRVCCDGPIFDAKDIRWSDDAGS